MSKKINNQKGFSLVELIIVLSVIGILSAIAIPKFSNIQNKAKESSVKALAHTIQLYIETFYLQESTYPTPTDSGVEALMDTLIAEDILTTIPSNPFTNLPYTDDDSSGEITYTLNSQSSYTLDAYGADNTEVILSLEND